MLIFRYLVKEVFFTMAATTAVLLLIFMSTQFVHYLSDAAFGRFTAMVLFHIMILQVPYLLGLLIPLGFYLAILTAYGRLYSDREMMVLASCGVSQGQILRMTLVMAVVMAIIVMILSCGLSPYVQRAQKQLEADAKMAPLVETVMPGRFYSLEGGKQIFYIADVSRDHTKLQNIFLAQQQKKNPLNWDVVAAADGYSLVTEGHQLVINDGNRYVGTPGNNDFQQQHFAKLTWFINPHQAQLGNRPEILSTAKLWTATDNKPQNAAELQWRLAMPISVLLLTLLAVPISKVNPRQGKFAQLVPAVLIYIFYANMTFVGRSWLESGTIQPGLGLWWLHASLLLIALGIMFFRSNFRFKVWKWMRYSA